MDHTEIIALAIVAVTAFFYLRSLVIKKSKSCCDKGCGSEKTLQKPAAGTSGESSADGSLRTRVKKKGPERTLE